MKNISYDFVDGQIVELYHDRPQQAWTIFDAPDDIIRRALSWNDPNGAFEELTRKNMLEIFLHDFVVSRAK